MRDDDREELVREAMARGWYHVMELAPGKTTRGMVDLRPVAPKVLPKTLSGARALDVASFDGFWSFEMERRGGHVVSVDIGSYDDSDFPPPQRDRLVAERVGTTPRDGFEIARRLLDSRAERHDLSVYDLDVDKIGGPVDYAVVGALLLHLRDPVGALERVHSVLAPGGRILIVEVFRLVASLLHPREPAATLEALTTDFNWWVGNIACLRAFLELAGFERPRRRAIFRWKSIPEMRSWGIALEARRA